MSFKRQQDAAPCSPGHSSQLPSLRASISVRSCSRRKATYSLGIANRPILVDRPRKSLAPGSCCLTNVRKLVWFVLKPFAVGTSPLIDHAYTALQFAPHTSSNPSTFLPSSGALLRPMGGFRLTAPPLRFTLIQCPPQTRTPQLTHHKASSDPTRSSLQTMTTNSCHVCVNTLFFERS